MVRVRGLLDRDEERRVRGTGGVCRSRGDRGGEPVDINISIQVTRRSFNATKTTVQSN